MNRRTLALGGTSAALLMLIACGDSASTSSSSSSSSSSGGDGGGSSSGDAGKTETCSDKVKNQDETDVDCGGSKCGKCEVPQACKAAADCKSGICTGGKCEAAPTCTDTVLNGTETDVDCGGSTCNKCADSKACKVASDCTSGLCDSTTKKCAPTPGFTSITPAKGGTAGGTAVSIVGTSFATTGVVSVKIGGVAATNVVVTNATTLTCDTGANLGKAGLADVVITNPNTGTVTGKDKFTYFYSTIAVGAPTDLVQTNGIEPVAVDLDKDGKLDLVVTSWNTPTISVRLGNGDGTFKAAVSFAPPNRVLAPRFGDINGDGKIDMIGGGDSANVTIALGNGDGTFMPPTSVTMGGGTYYSDLVDLNGDGKLDLLSPDGLNSLGVTIALGNGDGTFKAPTTLATIGLQSTIVRAVDVNGDNKPDLIVNDYFADNTLHVALGNGDGTFKAPTSVSAPAPGNIWQVLAVDVNADGKKDLVMGSLGGGILVAIGKGDGTFDPPVAYANGGASGTATVVVLDLDGDGVVDLVSPQFQGGELQFFRGNGDGTFAAPTSVMTGAGTVIYGLAHGDFNKDGKVDFAIADFSSEVFNVVLNASQ